MSSLVSFLLGKGYGWDGKVANKQVTIHLHLPAIGYNPIFLLKHSFHFKSALVCTIKHTVTLLISLF